MKINFENKVVKLSVGDLADFKTGPGQLTNRRQGRWRTQLGVEWHNQEKETSEAAGESGKYEVSLNGSWPYKGWVFNIKGRIDQWIDTDDKSIIREIKTTSYPLPAETDNLIETYPSYFAQLGTYLVLLEHMRSKSLPFSGELLFIGIEDNIRQTITDNQLCKDFFHTQIDALWQFVEDKRKRQEKLSNLPKLKAFEIHREGQEQIQEQLQKASEKSKITFFQAPTGFGKTGVALEFAINKIKEGQVKQVIYLTSKSSGQQQVMAQLSSMLPKDSQLYPLQVRNKNELCFAPSCRCEPNDKRLSQGDRWKRCGLSPLLFLKSPLNQPQLFRDAGHERNMCPYEIMRGTLPYADLWIGDLNYVFSPRNQSLFFEQPGFDLSKTLLIIDEAHNLPSRVADIFSYQISFVIVEQIHAELQLANVHPAIKRALESLMDFLVHITENEALDDTNCYECQDCMEALDSAVQRHPIHSDFLDEETIQNLWELSDCSRFFINNHLEKLIWSPSRGVVNLSCLDAAAEIADILQQTNNSLLMSATLEPQAYYLKLNGLLKSKQTPAWVLGNTPWRQGAYKCAVDMRVDTRYKSRNQHLFTTAETLANAVQYSRQSVAVFFPSYKYAQNIARALDNEFPHLRVALQQRGGTLDEQSAFIDESVEEADLILLILGSGFAEGIDHLGGKVNLAIIVGPALPEVNTLQRKRMTDRSKLGREAAFEEVYQIPGMQKINQALGRLVRAPGQKANVLFHCQRFAEPSYHDLLFEDFKTNVLIKSDDDLHDWLKSH